MAERMFFQESSLDRSWKILTSKGRNAIPRSDQKSGNVDLYSRYQIRPPEESNNNIMQPAFDLDDGVLSMDFQSLAVQGRDQPGLGSDDIDTNRLVADSSPHMNDDQGNPTCKATSTSTLENQREYHRPKGWIFPWMASIQVRRETLQDWPHVRPSAEDIANAFMFFQGPIEEEGLLINDQVVCCKCGQTFRGWEPNDDPITEHKRIYGECFETKWQE